MDEPIAYCEICESRHEPTCGQTYAEGLLKLTPEQYFAMMDGAVSEDGDDW